MPSGDLIFPIMESGDFDFSITMLSGESISPNNG
jgi:hypothetical protein